jgi:hypothetical protein
LIFKSKSIITVALSLVLALLLAGCSSAPGTVNTNNQTPAAAQSSTETASANPSSSSAPGRVLGTYKAVLQNKAEYLSTDSKKTLYLNDFLTKNEIYITTFQCTHFTVLDMDGDKVPEVVLELSVGNEPQFYEVLHYMNNDVYGYLVMSRSLQALKADGSFLFSSGAGDTGSGKLKFDLAACTTDRAGYSHPVTGNDGNLNISYFIDNKPAKQDAYDSFLNEQSEKKDAAWHEFSEKNIDTQLSANK